MSSIKTHKHRVVLEVTFKDTVTEKTAIAVITAVLQEHLQYQTTFRYGGTYYAALRLAVKSFTKVLNYYLSRSFSNGTR